MCELEKLKGRGCGFVALEVGATADHPTHDRFLVGLGSAANYVMSRDWLTLLWPCSSAAENVLNIWLLFNEIWLSFLIQLCGMCLYFPAVPDEYCFYLFRA